MNQQFLVSTVVIALGWVIKRFLIDERGAQVLVRLVFNVTLPALVLTTFDKASLEPSLALLPVIAVAYGLLMAGLGTLVLFRKRPRKERGQLSMLLPSFNIGLFAYPLVEASLGAGALPYLAMFDAGVAFITFGVAYAIASHFSREGAVLDLAFAGRQLLESVPFVAYVLAVLLRVAEGISQACDLLQQAKVRNCDLLSNASNYVFLATLVKEKTEVKAIYKPRQGEIPLWDFPDGTLYKREYAAFIVSQALEWHLIPPTVIRDGPYGIGSVQWFVDTKDGTETLLANKRHLDIETGGPL